MWHIEYTPEILYRHSTPVHDQSVFQNHIAELHMHYQRFSAQDIQTTISQPDALTDSHWLLGGKDEVCKTLLFSAPYTYFGK